jgi:Tfp pilus assembly protein PilX
VTRRPRDERGASLVLAIAFLVVVGSIGVAMLSAITSAMNDRTVLDGVRDREYAADGAIEAAIVQVRGLTDPGPGLAPCAPAGHYTHSLANIQIRVDCANAPTLTLSSFLQRNVIFSACLDTGAACVDANAIMRAQVNFQAVGSGAALQVTRTWVQSWSVNG